MQLVLAVALCALMTRMRLEPTHPPTRAQPQRCPRLTWVIECESERERERARERERKRDKEGGQKSVVIRWFMSMANKEEKALLRQEDADSQLPQHDLVVKLSKLITARLRKIWTDAKLKVPVSLRSG